MPRKRVPVPLLLLVAALTLTFLSGTALADGPVGYYRQPAIHGDLVVFVAEGDLWKVQLAGGVATRLTSHPADESDPAIAADGRTVAFVGQHEGSGELYTMPIDGGLPERRTWTAGGVSVSGWTPAGHVLYSTPLFSTLPSWQLVTLDVDSDATGVSQRIPLAQAADGSYTPDGRTLFFTRLRFQGSRTKRYRGGTAQNIWSFTEGDPEAVALTGDYAGTSKRPMFWDGRVYFASDRDGTMNLWSMDPQGGDLRQHTSHSGWDVASPDLHDGRIVYQLGADLRVLDLAGGTDREIAITLDTDLDQMRERWVHEPMDYLTSAHLSPTGDRVALTARGAVFVAPHGQGRFVQATRDSGVRHRDARFLPDGETLLTLADASGEVELWTRPANGVGDGEQLTSDGTVLRWEAVPSPDGKKIATDDKDQRLFLYDVESRESKEIDRNEIGGFSDLAWSPDSRWLAYSAPAGNMFSVIRLYSVETGEITRVTSDRFDSWSPAWGPDGEWLYLLSDRNLVSIVGSPWGNYQPEPYLDKTTRIYHVALREDLLSPFAPKNELQESEEKEEDEQENGEESGKDEGKKKTKKRDSKGEDEKSDEEPVLRIQAAGIAERLVPVPIDPGNYGSLTATEGQLFFVSRTTGQSDRSLVGVKITREEPELVTVADKVRGYELSGDGKKILLRSGNVLHVIDAKAAKAKLDDKTKVDLSSWTLSVTPREEWRQMFIEAWRLERDYFYDRDMHGVDWPAIRDKYLKLVDRVTTRAELSDLIAQMVGELSALHIFVVGGDLREGPDQIRTGSLGAVLVRDEPGGGYRVEHVYDADPDEPGRSSPLARPGVDVRHGDVIETINGVPTLSAPDPSSLLRKQAGRQTLLRVARDGESRDVIVEPISTAAASDLRYHEWEYTRRLRVEEGGAGRVGYVHLRAMGGRNFTEWAKGFYPVFDREGLIIDVRNNRGGNIDSWILGRLLRKAWFGWSQHAGQAPIWNMQYAFRGHVVVLCNERTASDGEAFSEGIRRLGIGTIIGTRTWGGEIWLSANNFLVDRGIATAAEFGVYGPDGTWLIEGHGVDPDIVVDNLPHATFGGEDAQLEAAIEFLNEKIVEEPVPELVPPPHPDKSFDYPER